MSDLPLLILIGILLVLLIYSLSKSRSRIPRGEIVYNDLSRPEKPLYSNTLDLVGKPDLVIKRSEVMIPIEYKSSKTPLKPYRSHVLQLAAYCWLVEENFGAKVPYGLLVYNGRNFRVDFDDQLRKELMNTVGWMRDILKMSPEEAKKYRNERNCRFCYLREVCKRAFSEPDRNM